MSSSAPIGHIRIPGYNIQQEVGRGGIATVYLAVQESLDRQVALKIMAPALTAEPNFTERFIREGRTVAQLTHPGIVTIYDISVADYQHYIAMEYLSGGSLKERMRKRMPAASALSIVRQVAAALGYAHGKGFVHRDVKPENIIFRGDDTPVLTDFGIAKSTASSTHLTSAGVIVGTPRYMSPEQADGRGTDPRSDIYALGIILYELLTGSPPFDGKESIAVLYSHINDPIPQLPDEYAALQPLIDGLMAKEPNERVGDCDTLIDMLRTAQRGERISRRNQAKAVGSKRRRRQNQSPRAKSLAPLAGWLGAAAAVLLVGVWVAQALLEPPPSESPVTAAAETGPAAPPPPVSDTPAPTPAAGLVAAEDRPSAETVPQPPEDTHARDETPATDARPEPEQIVALTPTLSPSPTVARTEREEPVPAKPSRSQATTQAKQKRRAAPARAAGWRSDGTTDHIDALLQLAQKQIEQDRLSHPPGDNAMETYRDVLALAPGNEAAITGLDQLAGQYLQLAEEKVAAGKYQSALSYAERGLAAVPEHGRLDSLSQRIREMIEAEQLFAAAEKHFRGLGRPKDQAAAAVLYRQAAQLGHKRAQYSLGVAYANGAGVLVDETEALRWLRKAAREGEPEAQYNFSLGLVFGPRPDPSSAARIIKQLAEREYAPAFRLLGWMYNTGTGVDRSMTESVKWATKDFTRRRMGSPPLPGRVINNWQQQFEAELKEAAKLVEQAS